MLTHEHLDHVMAVVRHPEPAAIAPRLRLTATQIAGLPEHAVDGVLDPAIADSAPLALDGPTRIAPGVVVAPAAGHSPGSVVIYARTAAHEYLFVGDIVWAYSNIPNLKSRPRFIGWAWGLDDDRAAVLRQVRALHDLTASDPNLIIVPAHDEAHLQQLVATGAIAEGFTE